MRTGRSPNDTRDADKLAATPAAGVCDVDAGAFISLLARSADENGIYTVFFGYTESFGDSNT
jgi:hypothetical protein